MRKVLFYFLLLCLLDAATVMTGCAKEEDSTNDALLEETAQELVYVPSYSEYEFSYKANVTLNPLNAKLFLCGNKMYAVVYRANGTTDSVYILNLTTGEQTQKELPEQYGRYFRTAEGFAGFYDIYKILRIYDKEFNEVNEIELKTLEEELRQSGKYLYCEDIAVDSEGYAGIIDRDGEDLFILDKNGNRLCSFTPLQREENFAKLGVAEDGNWYVFCDIRDMIAGKNMVSVYRVDIEGGELEWKAEIGLNGGADYCIYPSNKSFYIATSDRIYRYETETMSCEEMFRMTDYGISLTWYSDISAFGILEGGEPAVITETDYALEDQETKRWRSQLELCTLTGKPVDEVQPRKELVLAVMYSLSPNDQKPILYFNKYNSEYYVTVKSYAEMTHSGYEEIEQFFYNDLILGKGADIFYFGPTEVDFESLRDKRVFADLYEFMDADGEIGREDFIPNIISAMEHNGKLYAITPCFMLETLIGKEALLSRYSE